MREMSTYVHTRGGGGGVGETSPPMIMIFTRLEKGERTNVYVFLSWTMMYSKYK